MPPSNEGALFALALTKPPAKRAAWLDAECQGEPALRARLAALLAAHEQPETLLATPAEAARQREDASSFAKASGDTRREIPDQGIPQPRPTRRLDAARGAGAGSGRVGV